jgi:hypothetical protein
LLPSRVIRFGSMRCVAAVAVVFLAVCLPLAAQSDPPELPLEVPEPVQREALLVTSSGGSSLYYRSESIQSGGSVLRVAPGFLYRDVAGDASARSGFGFALDAYASAWTDVGRGDPVRWALGLETGYHLGTAPGDEITHTGGVGVGMGLRSDYFMAMLVSRGELGYAYGGFGGGIRSVFRLSVSHTFAFALEVSHRWLSTGLGDVHDLITVVSVDMVRLLELDF